MFLYPPFTFLFDYRDVFTSVASSGRDPCLELKKDVVWQPWYLPWVYTAWDSQLPEQACIDAYISHNERIKSLAKKEQLLVLEMDGKWEPLCDFLGVETPKDTPFPMIDVDVEEQGQELLMHFFTVSYPFIPVFLIYLLHTFLHSFLSLLTYKSKHPDSKKD